MVRDLRSYLEQLDRLGWLRRVRRQVSPRHELAAVLDRALRRETAVLFERVEGSPFPVVGNLVVSRDMLALALDCARNDVARVWNARAGEPILPRLVDGGPVKDVVKLGAEADLSTLPIVTHSEKDAGAYITGGLVVSRNPDKGNANVSFNRMMYRAPNESNIRMMPSQHLGMIQAQAEREARPLEVAVVLGVHPTELLAAATTIGYGQDEFALAGALRQEPLELVRAETVDLRVPAHAEMVLEGEILPGTLRQEGPFGDFMQFYAPAVDSPVFRIRALTHRRDPFYHTILAGTRDDMHLLAPSREALIQEVVEKSGTLVQAVSLLPTILGCAISIEKRYEREAKNVAAVALGIYRWLKTCIVVDHDVDVFDAEEVMWAFSTRCRPDRGTFVIPEAMGFPRDPYQVHQGKIGIDATIPLGQWEEFERKRVPGAEELNLDDYLE